MKVDFIETVLRDANQSLMATRMPSRDFIDILDTMDRAGYYAVECWGGATFDSCIRFLDEDPWDRLRILRSHFQNTRLQMLLRGQNILGYKHYPDDIVRLFVAKAVENGIDIVRVFDALNDPLNLKTAIDETKKRGAEAQGTICYTRSPIHTLEKYAELAKQLLDMGCDSICIKDMAGIMTPKDAYDLVKVVKEETALPVQIHTHCTTGLAPLTLLKAIEAGADRVDTAISCFSGGTSQFATESLAFALEDMGYEPTLDFDTLHEINEFFRPLKKKAIEDGLTSTYVMGTETNALIYQVPGGMLSNLQANLRDMNASDKLQQVLEEVPRVREDMGYPPLVTPSSQITGGQAVANVLTGERYKVVSKEMKAYFRGEYGHAPGKINEEIQKKVLNGAEPITCRPADLLEPGFEIAKEEIGPLAHSDEDVLTYALFPEHGREFLEKREVREVIQRYPSSAKIVVQEWTEEEG